MKVKLWRRVFAASMSAAMLLGLTACGGGSDSTESSDGIKTFTMFTAMPGSEINDDNEIMNIIADLHFIAHAVVQCFCHTADRCVQAGAVATGSQDTNTNCHTITSHMPRPARFLHGCTVQSTINLRHRGRLVNPAKQKWTLKRALQKT